MIATIGYFVRRKYIEADAKYYAVGMRLCNARMNFGSAWLALLDQIEQLLAVFTPSFL